jgi:hypothetical protein
MEAKNCAKCGKVLPTLFDEYGPVREPVCQACWFNPGREVPGKRSQQITLVFEDDDEQA